MMPELNFSERKRTARLAGLLYLLVVISGIFCLIYTPSQVIVRGNPAETASRILAHETLYRIDVVVGLLSTILFLFLVLVLYRLFRDVNRWQALVMLVLVIVQIPFSAMSLVVQLGSLELVRGAGFLSILDISRREVLAMLCIHINALGAHLSEMFWGLWLFPLGMLVIRSGFIPRFLGVWLIINGIAYVFMSMTGLLAPPYYGPVANIAIPAMIGEVVFTFWLLFAGIRPVGRAAVSRAH